MKGKKCASHSKKNVNKGIKIRKILDAKSVGGDSFIVLHNFDTKQKVLGVNLINFVICIFALSDLFRFKGFPPSHSHFIALQTASAPKKTRNYITAVLIFVLMQEHFMRQFFSVSHVF